MAAKDDNKHKYVVDSTEEEAEKAPLKKQKTIGGDDNGDDHGDYNDNHGDNNNDEGDDNGDSSSSSSTIHCSRQRRSLRRRK
jgi:hypothetical protein